MDKTQVADRSGYSPQEVPFADKRSGSRYLGLQWARIAACLMVLVFHATLYLNDGYIRIYYRGASGVDMFFVLSGFVIFISSRKLELVVGGWKIFARHRLLRILPMYWLITTLNLILLTLEAHMRGRALPNWLWVLCSYCFIPYRSSALEPGPVLGVGWTLEFEMLFYAICTISLMQWRRILPYTFVPLLALAIGSFWRSSFHLEIFRFLDPVVLEFAFGMLVARLCYQRRYLSAWLAGPLAVVAFALLCHWPWPLGNLHRLDAGVLSAALIYAVASLEDHLPRTPHWVLVMADATYLLYLIHVPILLEVSKATQRLHVHHPVLAMACASMVSIVLAVVMRLKVEAPILRWLQPRSGAASA
ncbi:acyltransferase family protein [Terriglobus sp. ADX1]|uniref:acyltransferase family protein n=1 Tax=Terriglobus sp. ADX1 TaxID=2794063 RepID=UPI002FE58512